MSPSTTRRVRIVFAFVDTGMGHRAPALAVREHLERTRPNRFDVVLVDLLAELGLAGLDRFAKAVWSKWLLRHPLLIDSAYWTGHVYSAVLLPAMAFFLAPQFHRLERYCRRLHADLLVTTHILSTNPLAILRERGRLGSPVAGMVVDPFDKYRISGHAGLDALITFSHRSMAAYRAMYPTVDVVRFGFPLSARFDSRPAPRLRTPTFTLLMTAGAEGGARLCEYVERILAASLGIRIVVVCGRDGSLRRRLRSLVHGSTPDAGSRPECAVLGFVDNMDELISSCELFVGTGGANLTMEALSLGRPTILTLYCPNVRGTVDWVVRRGFGWRCTSADSFVPLVQKLLRRPEMLREAERRIAAAGLRSGTPELSDYLARLASRGTGPARGDGLDTRGGMRHGGRGARQRRDHGGTSG